MHVKSILWLRKGELGAVRTHGRTRHVDTEIELVYGQRFRTTIHGGQDTHAGGTSGKTVQTPTAEHIYEFPRRWRGIVGFVR